MSLFKRLKGQVSAHEQDKATDSRRAESAATGLVKIGNVEPICPYCSRALDSKPSRKKKCPHCESDIFVRTRPIDREEVLVTEKQAAQIEEQWNLYHEQELEHIDTGKASIIHWLFPSSPSEDISLFRHIIVPYVATALATYGAMLIIAVLSPSSVYTRSQSLKIPFLLDANVAWMFLWLLPLIVVFIVTEHIMIPSGIGKIKESGVFSIADDVANELKSSWEKHYKLANILGQIIGAIVGIAIALISHTTFTQTGFGSWQAANGNTNPVGWYFLACMFFFIFALSVIFIRNLTTILFLMDMVRNSTIEIIPFHPDKCGGLKPIGILGLRNQYILSSLGINIILLFSNTMILDSNTKMQTQVIVSLIMYIVLGPISFLGPLLPFRNAMLKDKSRLVRLVANRIKKDFNRITELIDEGKMTKKDDELLTRHKHIGDLIGKLPVWPFDIATVTKFITAYLLPFLAWAIGLLLPEIFRIYFPQR